MRRKHLLRSMKISFSKRISYSWRIHRLTSRIVGELYAESFNIDQLMVNGGVYPHKMPEM